MKAKIGNRREFPSYQHEAIYVYMKHHATAKIEDIAKFFGLKTRTMYRIYSDLKEQGFISNERSEKDPKWIVKNE